MYRQLYVEWIFVHQNEHGFIKKKKEIRNTCTMSRKNKDVEYKNIICSLALDDMLDHNYWVCTNAMLS